MKIISTNSPKNILRKWQERAQDSERVFLSATPGLIRPQGDIHLIHHKIDHVIDSDWQEDDVHLRAGRPDRDQDGAAGRRLHRLRPLLGEGVFLFPYGGTGSIWHFYVLATYLFPFLSRCPETAGISRTKYFLGSTLETSECLQCCFFEVSVANFNGRRHCFIFVAQKYILIAITSEKRPPIMTMAK